MNAPALRVSVSQHFGYCVVFVEPDGRVSGFVSSTIENYREAHATRRRLAKSWPGSKMRVARVEGYVR